MGNRHDALLEAIKERNLNPVYIGVPSINAVKGIIMGIEFLIGNLVKTRVVKNRDKTYTLYVDIADELAPTHPMRWEHYGQGTRLIIEEEEP